jgi:hypothetical protein
VGLMAKLSPDLMNVFSKVWEDAFNNVYANYPNLDKVVITKQFPTSYVAYDAKNDWFFDVIEWVSCPNRAGHFVYATNDFEDFMLPGVMAFWFSDQNIAFEFKMRWA